MYVDLSFGWRQPADSNVFHKRSNSPEAQDFVIRLDDDDALAL